MNTLGRKSIRLVKPDIIAESIRTSTDQFVTSTFDAHARLPEVRRLRAPARNETGFVFDSVRPAYVIDHAPK